MRFQLIVLSALVAGLPLLSGAKPVVIFDNGRSTRLPHQPQTLHVKTPVVANFDVQIEPFPVKTPSLSPGKVASRTIDLPYLDRPLFIVGADPLSIRWLRLYQAQLEQLKAIGLAVNVETQAELNQL